MPIPWQAFAVLVLILGYVDWDRSRQIERAVTAKIEAEKQRMAREYSEETAALSQKHIDDLAEKDREHNRQLGERETEINQLRLRADKLAKVDPLGFGNDYHVRLARVMCRIEAGTDSGARQTCDNAPAEAYLSDVAFTITVTAETAEQWAELCEEGNRDFCDWSLTGRTPQGALTELAWLEKVDGFALAQGLQIDSFHDLVKGITASGEKEAK